MRRYSSGRKVFNWYIHDIFAFLIIVQQMRKNFHTGIDCSGKAAILILLLFVPPVLIFSQYIELYFLTRLRLLRFLFFLFLVYLDIFFSNQILR